MPIFCAAVVAGRRGRPIYGDGTQTRDYVYVGDVVAAFLAAADRGRPGTWNIGTGAEVSVLDLVESSAEVAGRPSRAGVRARRAGGAARSALACDRAERDLGWRPGTRWPSGDPRGLPVDQGRGARTAAALLNPAPGPGTAVRARPR